MLLTSQNNKAYALSKVKVKSESEAAQSCPALFDPMGCSPPGSSAHGIFQARVLEWVPSPSPTLLLTPPYFPRLLNSWQPVFYLQFL